MKSQKATQIASPQISAQTILNNQAQAFKTQVAEQERLANLSLEQLEKTYESQYMIL